VTAAATRDDLASVVTALTEQAATQRQWQAQYEAMATAENALVLKSETPSAIAWHRANEALHERHAATARGTAHAFEVSADMIRKYVDVKP
jgi:hypothetical protein